MEWIREDYLAYMRGEKTDRPMFVELFGPLVGLADEWRAQGAAENEMDLTAFGFDHVRRCSIDVATGHWPCEPGRILAETDEALITRDGMGRTMKLSKGRASIPLPLDYPVKDEKDWARVKDQYVFSPDRFEPGWAERAVRRREDGALVVASIEGGYDGIRQLMGDEEACISFYTRPELIRDMLATFQELNHQILSRVAANVTVDQLSVHEDFAGKSGPLVGPNIIGEFLAPYYDSAWREVNSTAQLYQLDSDGDIGPIVEDLMKAGINSILPNEPAAGMDVVELRRRFGVGLKLVGGIDKFAVRTSREAIDAELEYKLQPLMRTGGVVFGLDHRIPNGTPLELYRYYVRRSRDILGLEPEPQPSWARMAF